MNNGEAAREPVRLDDPHLTTIGRDRGGWTASCTCARRFPWHNITAEGAKNAKDHAQQDAIAHLREVRT